MHIYFQFWKSWALFGWSKNVITGYCAAGTLSISAHIVHKVEWIVDSTHKQALTPISSQWLDDYFNETLWAPGASMINHRALGWFALLTFFKCNCLHLLLRLLIFLSWFCTVSKNVKWTQKGPVTSVKPHCSQQEKEKEFQVFRMNG